VFEGAVQAIEWTALNAGMSEENASRYALFMGMVLPQNTLKGLARAARLTVYMEMSGVKTGITTAVKTGVKGNWGEAWAAAALEYKNYAQMPCRLPGNRGMDHVFVKYGPNKIVEEIVVVESKFATGGGAPKLARTEGDKVQQLSNAWLDKQHTKLKEAHPETWKLIDQNKDKIRFKANVLDDNKVNKWYDYGQFDKSNLKEKTAIRTKKGLE
jgi:hypothetical protein